MPKMPESGQSIRSLSEAQLRRLLISCQHMDKLLADVENILHAPESTSAFPKYVDDLSPVQHRKIQDLIGQLRAQLLRAIARQGMAPEKPRIAASHAIRVALTFVEIAIEELRPEKMRGYGQISPAGTADLNAVVQELHGCAQQLHQYLPQEKGPTRGVSSE